MRSFIHTFARPSARLAARLRNARPGSVLILVVALLVLMALIGTAWLTTARTDRYSSRQNTYNTQVDLLLEAVKTLAKSAIVDDLFAQSRYRPSTGTLNADYEHYDAPGNRDPFLADRLPVESGGQYQWPSISRNPTGGGFEAPFAVGVTPAGLPYRYTAASDIEPTSVDVPTSTGVTTLPALEIGGGQVVAADTDGDGIADAGLFRLPVGDIAGVTYYGAIRIVDNNSAVNVNTAWVPEPTGPAYQFFPSNINFLSLLNPTDPDTSDAYTGTQAEQMNGLNRVRFTADRADDQSTAALPVPLAVKGDSDPATRADFMFSSDLHAVWQQMGSRIENPGYFGATATKYNPLTISEQMGLASRFILRNPFANRSILDDKQFRTGHSFYDTPGLATAPYDPNDVAAWYTDNFAFVRDGTQQKHLRSIAVTRNAVSNARIGHPGGEDSDQNWQNNVAYNFGDRVYHSGRTYVAMLDIPAPPMNQQNIAPDQAAMDFFWAPMSWKTHPTKASVNTASFAELWFAYLNVMDERPAGATAMAPPYPATGDDATSSPKSRRFLRSPMRNPNHSDYSPNPPFTAPGDDNQGINRPTLVGATQLLPSQVMKLRAALAAVNTIDLRDGDRDITARRVILNANIDFDNDPTNAAPPTMVEVNAYGYEPQPFITEIYVNNFNLPDLGGRVPTPNPNGYVAIELYNPYPFDISLEGWQIGVIDRRSLDPRSPNAPQDSRFAPNAKYYSRYPFMVIQPLTGFTGFGTLRYSTVAEPANSPNVPVVPANGRLILENYATPPNHPNIQEGRDIDRWESAYNNYPATRMPSGQSGADLRTQLIDELKTKNASYRPVSSRMAMPFVPTATVRRYFVPSLHEVILEPANTQFRGGEVYLLRPRRADGTLSSDNRPDSSYRFSELNSDWLDPDFRGAALSELIPVDSVDLAGISLSAAGPFQNWHYVRANGGANQWRAMYPGRWDPSTPWELGAPPASLSYREEGITTSATYDVGGPDPWEQPGSSPRPIDLGGLDGGASFLHPFQAVQLSNTDQPGWNNTFAPGGVTPNAMPFAFPFGGFARTGDIMHVHFMGAYRIKPLGGYPALPASDLDYPNGMSDLNPVFELNPITKDMLFAHDADSQYGTGLHAADADNDVRNVNVNTRYVTDDVDEQVGRFVPIDRSPRVDPTPMYAGPAVQDFEPDMTGDSSRYRWALDLFDHLTIASPQDDYLPNVDPAAFDFGLARPGFLRKYPTSTGAAAYPPPPYGPPGFGDPLAPQPVPNKAGANYATANRGQEDGIGTEGLININTAPAIVLSTLPFVAAGTDAWSFNSTNGLMDTATANGVDDNLDIARAIVYCRDVDNGTGTPHGPFKSLHELNLVYDPSAINMAITDPLLRLGLRNLWGTFNMPAGPEPDDAAGDFSPFGIGSADGVRLDYEERYLMMNRLSNLVAVRSDTFTVYVQVQGWRGVGTPNPELVVQRRAAFIADRNNINQGNRLPETVNVPTN